MLDLDTRTLFTMSLIGETPNTVMAPITAPATMVVMVLDLFIIREFRTIFKINNDAKTGLVVKTLYNLLCQHINKTIKKVVPTNTQ